MHIKHIWSVLCRESVINQDDNVVSLHGVLEQLTLGIQPKPDGSIPSRINVPITYEIVSFWIKDHADNKEVKADIEIKLVDPAGAQLMKTAQQMILTATTKRFRSRMKISGIGINRSGDYHFQVWKKETGEKSFHLISELPLEVQITIHKPPKEKVVN